MPGWGGTGAGLRCQAGLARLGPEAEWDATCCGVELCGAEPRRTAPKVCHEHWREREREREGRSARGRSRGRGWLGRVRERHHNNNAVRTGLASAPLFLSGTAVSAEPRLRNNPVHPPKGYSWTPIGRQTSKAVCICWSRSPKPVSKITKLARKCRQGQCRRLTCRFSLPAFVPNLRYLAKAANRTPPLAAPFFSILSMGASVLAVGGRTGTTGHCPELSRVAMQITRRTRFRHR